MLRHRKLSGRWVRLISEAQERRVQKAMRYAAVVWDGEEEPPPGGWERDSLLIAKLEAILTEQDRQLLQYERRFGELVSRGIIPPDMKPPT